MLEWDADSYAASTHAGRIVKQGERTPVPERDLESAFFAWSFAVGTWFRVHGDERFTDFELTYELYPPLRLRHHMATLTVLTYLLERGFSEQAEGISEVVIDALAALEDAFPVVTGEARSVAGLADAMGPIGRDHLSRLDKHWKQLVRPTLEPYTHSGLPD